MKRYALKIAYDGSKYYGWQVQPISPTIQETLQNALEKIAKQPITVIGAGRTDTGVHALGQVAHFDFPVEMSTEQLMLAIHSKIPHSIQITHIVEVAPDFHSRYDAISRTYQYIITTAPSPFNYHYKSSFPRYQISLERFVPCMTFFLGKQDFSSFAKPNPSNKNYTCDVKDMRIERIHDDIIITITADRFLHNMVRRIIGAMIAVSHKNLPPEIISEWIASKKHSQKNYITASPNGLYLVKVGYTTEVFSA